MKRRFVNPLSGVLLLLGAAMLVVWWRSDGLEQSAGVSIGMHRLGVNAVRGHLAIEFELLDEMPESHFAYCVFALPPNSESSLEDLISPSPPVTKPTMADWGFISPAKASPPARNCGAS